MLDKLISLVAPHECVGCGLEGSLLCDDCSKNLPETSGRCWRCHKADKLARTCLNCRRHSKLYAVRAVSKYSGSADLLVRKLKYSGAVAAAAEMAELMAPLLPNGKNIVLSFLPTATGRVRSRGFDQARLIARELSNITGLAMIPFLSRTNQAHQVGSSRKNRLEHAKNMFRVRNQNLLEDQTVIVIDDVITTGASLDAAATVLKQNGAKRIYGLVFCRA